MKTANSPIKSYQMRPPANINMIVVHSMAEFVDTEDLDYFAPDYLKHIGLSCHAFITPSGVVIRQVPDDGIAHHAKGYNQRSLGVELLVPGLHTWSTFSDTITNVEWVSMEQQQALRELLNSWKMKYSLDEGMIKLHSDLSPKRKIDPGEMFEMLQIIV